MINVGLIIGGHLINKLRNSVKRIKNNTAVIFEMTSQRKVLDNFHVFKMLSVLIALCTGCIVSSQAQNNENKLAIFLSELERAPHDSLKSELCSKISKIYSDRGAFDSSEYFGNRG